MLASLTTAVVVAAGLTAAPTDFARLAKDLSHKDKAVRAAAAQKLTRIEATQQKRYLARLKRYENRRHTLWQRRFLLKWKVSVPPPSGWFKIPKLKPGEKSPADTDLLAVALAEPPPALPAPRAALAAMIETIAVIRGLAGLRSFDIAEPLIRFSFTPGGIVFRWVVVRAIRGLGGYAVPPLLKLGRLRVSDWRRQRQRFLLRRFVLHLISTMEQANPRQALAMAERPLKLKLLAAYGKYRDADAVGAVIGLTDTDDPEIRAAARAALSEYFKGKAPRTVARRLKLAGGKETRHRKRLFLNYRQRATYEIRMVLESLTRGKYDRGIPGKQLMNLLYQEQDRRRATRWDRRFQEAQALFAAGKTAEAVARCGDILSHAPDYGRRAEMFPILFAQARNLTMDGKLRDAAALFFRAAMVIPAGSTGEHGRWRRTALADAAYVRALLSEARGKRREAVYLHRTALQYRPDHTAARVALTNLAPQARVDPYLPWVVLGLAALGFPGLLWLVDTLRRMRRS